MPISGKKDAVGLCIKETGNWSKISSEHKFDHKTFSKETFLKDIAPSAPKLKTLIENIQSLDAKDLKEHGRFYKHFIYSDIKSSYGAKLIASALNAYGYEHAYHLAKTQRGMSFQLKTDTLNKNSGNVFATLTSVSFFEKPIGVNFRKELLKVFNSRPDNVYGDKIRIIILDSGFREGVDLFDVKYAHIFEPIITVADEKQAIGRVTRYCGQKGLEFHPLEGWPVQVYRYETILPKAIRKLLHVQYPDLVPSETFFQMFMKFSNVDPKKITFANELEKVSIRAAVDYELTRSVHEFKIGGKIGKYTGGTSKPGDAFMAYQKNITERYKKYTWPPIKIENGCTGAPIPQAINEEVLKEEITEYFSPTESFKTESGQTSSKSSGGALILPFTPTQDFIRHYFTPSFEKHGMLLWHSVGTGKTCTAIATASSSFERENYTIIYVTRHTLKGDVWKNMFDQVCSSILQERIAQGMELPEAQAQRMRLLQGRWIEPMSYRQFSNMLDGKSRLYEDLVKRNGKKDPLHKTLVIIDEVHKMFAPDVTGSEKPDMDVIKNAFDHSMKVSGKDGVRMLFMTATPYTSEPMDLIRILNLLRPSTDKLPESFDDFAKDYLNENGEFSEEGKLSYWDRITGYISYLNREKDIRTFSYAVLNEVQVPMSNYEFDSMIQDLLYQRILLNDKENKLRNNRSLMQQDVYKLKSSLDKEYTELLKKHTTEIAQCIKTQEEKQKLDSDKAYQQFYLDQKACKDLEAQCIKDLKDVYKQAVSHLKANAKAEQKDCNKNKSCIDKIKEDLTDELDDLKSNLAYDIDDCKTNPIIKKCLATAKSVYKEETERIEKGLEYCNQMKKLAKETESKEKERHAKQIADFKTAAESKIKLDEEYLRKQKLNFKKLQEDFHMNVEQDRSQRKRLENCLGIQPAYKRIINNDPLLMNVEIETGPDINDEEAEAYSKALEEQGALHNVFFVSGHGSEQVESFSKRVKMPKDKILIVFPVCARPNFMNNACEFLHEFQKPEFKKLFMDPLRNRHRIMQLIRQPIRIYLPGEKVPNLSTNLFLNFEKDKTVIMKSGVFRMGNIPLIDHNRFKKSSHNLGSDLCNSYIGEIENPMHYNKAIHYEVYKGNIYSPLKTKKPYSEMVYANYTLQNIMKDVGPGVYYYIGCRSSHRDVEPNIYEKIYIESQAQQEQLKRSERNKELKKFIIRHKDSAISPIESPPTNITPPKPPSVKPEKKKKEEDEKKPSTKEKRKQEREARKQADNTSEEKQELKTMLEDIKTWEEMLFATDIEPSFWNTLDGTISLWSDKLDAMKQTQRVKNVRFELELLNDMRMNKDKAKIEYYIREEKHTIDSKVQSFKAIYKGFVFKYKTVTRKPSSQLIGLIPTHHKDASTKCNTDILVKRIKKLLDKNISIILPSDASQWKGDSENLFHGLCSETKRLWKARNM